MSGSELKFLEQKLSQIAEDVSEIKEILTGNGEPSKGLIVRFDRIEQSQKRASWLAKTAIGASVVAILAVISKVLFGV